MLPTNSKKFLSENLRSSNGGTDTQAFRERIAKKTGGSVSARTIGNMVSGSGNPTLESIESVAEALGVSAAELLSENLGRSAKPASTHPHPSPIGTVSSSAPDASPLQLSPNAERLVRLVSLIDQLGSASDVLGAAETLLRRTLPNQSTLAYGPPGLQSLFEQYTKDPASLTPDAIATLNRQLVRAAKANTSQEKRDGQRDQSEDTGT